MEQAQQSLITEATKMLDKLLSKRSLLIETVHSRTRKMRDLGTIPHAELEEYKSLSEKHIMHRLNSVNEQVMIVAVVRCAGCQAQLECTLFFLFSAYILTVIYLIHFHYS